MRFSVKIEWMNLIQNNLPINLVVGLSFTARTLALCQTKQNLEYTRKRP